MSLRSRFNASFPRLAAMMTLAWIYVAPVRSETLDSIKEVVRKKFPTVRHISTAELAAWLADTNRPAPLLVDAREKEEFAVSHLFGASNLRSVAEVKAASRANARPVVTYCSVGYRSTTLAQKLLRAGATNVLNLEGSIFQWANEGRPVYRGADQVSEIHPYSRKWGRMLDRKLWPRDFQ